MKEGICNIIWVICCAVMLLSGCDSFLDVQPKGIVEQKKQFEDIQGYRDAMYGIYASMAKPELYGKAMSYGFMDQIGQHFFTPNISVLIRMSRLLRSLIIKVSL